MQEVHCTVSANIEVGFGEPVHISVSAHPAEIKDAVLAAREAAIYGALGEKQVEKNRAEYAARKAEELKAKEKAELEARKQEEIRRVVMPFLKEYGMYIKGNLHVTGDITCDNDIVAYSDEPCNTTDCCDRW